MRSLETTRIRSRSATSRSAELAQMWHFSVEFVRQIVGDEPGVTEWVRQQPGKRRYRVLSVPQSVVERLYRRAQTRAEQEGQSPSRWTSASSCSCRAFTQGA